MRLFITMFVLALATLTKPAYASTCSRIDFQREVDLSVYVVLAEIESVEKVWQHPDYDLYEERVEIRLKEMWKGWRGDRLTLVQGNSFFSKNPMRVGDEWILFIYAGKADRYDYLKDKLDLIDTDLMVFSILNDCSRSRLVLRDGIRSDLSQLIDELDQMMPNKYIVEPVAQ